MRSPRIQQLAALMVMGCSTPVTAEVPHEVANFTFEQHQIALGSAKGQTVLTGFLLGEALVDLVVVNVDENGDRRLRIYGFVDGENGGDGTWTPRLDAELGSEVSFVDVANIGGRDRLITYQHGRLNWFDPESAEERELVAVTPNDYRPPRGQILHLDFTRDLNGDGRDDLALPASHGFWVFIQMESGAFADPVKLGVSTRMHRYTEMGLTAGSDGYRYHPWDYSRVHEMDHNRDGRTDLVFWNEDHFEVHYQDERGLFAPMAETFTTDVAFDSDGLYSFVLDASGDEWRVLHSLGDLNGDGVADLVALSAKGASRRTTWSTTPSQVIMDSRYEVHLGTETPAGGIAFAPDVDTAIRVDRVLLEMRQHDFDRDGRMDTMLTTGKFSILKLLGALLAGSVPLDLELYRMEDGTYPAEPNATRRIRADAPPWRRVPRFYPSVLIGDVNGDQRLDLLVQKGRNELLVFLGVPGPDLIAPQPQKVAVAMPADEEYTWLVDLNGDGKQGILMHHPSTTEPHRVTMLIAR